MIGNFDKAFLKKVQAVWPNTIYANTAVTYNAVYSGGNSPIEGKMKFPLVNIYRPDGYEVLEFQTLPGRLQGYSKVYKDDKKAIFSRFILVRIAYQLNIFAKTLEELDQIVSDLIIMFDLQPGLKVVQRSKNKEVAHKEEYYLKYLRGPIEQSTFDEGDRIYTYALAYELPTAKLIHFREINLVDNINISIALEENPELTDNIEINTEE